MSRANTAIDAHQGSVESGEWWACDYPERPADPDWTIFDVRCPPCLLAGDAAVKHLALWWGMDVRSEDDPDGDEPWSVADFWLWRNGSEAQL